MKKSESVPSDATTAAKPRIATAAVTKPRAAKAPATKPAAVKAPVAGTPDAATKAVPKPPAAAKPAKPATARSARSKATKPAATATGRAAARTAAKTAATSAPEAAPHSIGLPKRPRPARKVAASARLDMARRIVALAEDKKAADILLLDLEGLTTLADAFVICSGGSERQLESIADGIVRGMRAEGIRPIGTEGLPASHWMLVDFGDVIVHIFTPPERDYYGLEKHWSEAKAVLRVQ
ncbi:MAG TPA: ribosome silencing factor [Candidatus Limnocylindrales bacterium]|nr:ribosome silencing factor [Candidatus Limnocylindrales bacterium]